MLFIFTVIYICTLLKIIIDGHINAVKQSEGLISDRYNRLGESSNVSRELMREAGYRV